MENKNRLIPVTKWNQYHQWPRVNGLQQLIFHADAINFKNVIVHVRCHILIDEVAFFDWLNKYKYNTIPYLSPCFKEKKND